MEAEKIKGIREDLGLSKDQFANVLSVTQVTVTRWEEGNVKPSGSTAFKLAQLAATLANPTEWQKVKDILAEPGGVATMAALLTLGCSFERAASSIGIMSLFAPSGISSSLSALMTLRVLNKIVEKQKGEKRMAELPLRESDIDLVPLLRKCTNEDLDPLVQYILQKGWLSSELDITEVYQKNQPNHTAYVDEICSEIQRFGGHTIANWIRGGEGASYQNIVCSVAKRLKVNFNEHREVEVIEEQILLKFLEKAWEKMSEVEKRDLSKSLPKGTKIGKEFPFIAFQAVFKAGGFKSYQIMLIVANAMWKFIFGKGLPLVANAALARWASVLTGPVGLAISSIWTIYDLGGPAYRVIIPCVIHIAMLRRLVPLREAGEDPASETP